MNAKIRSLIQWWLIHLSILLAVILFFSSLNRHNLNESVWQYFVRHLLSKDIVLATTITLLAEICYQYLFRKMHLVFFVLCCLISALVMLVVISLTRDVPLRWSERIDILSPLLFAAGYIFVYALVRNYFYGISVTKDIQLNQFKHELDALKAQLNPHFLFNSLNYLYGTALNEKAAQTADGIDQLSEMMRYTISGIHQNFVPLQHEIDFIAHYVSLQQARLPEKDSIKVNIVLPQQVPALQIAPLVLLPFIENAFKYGISMDEPCFVDINIGMDGTELVMTSTNSIAAKPIEIAGNNTGIKNTVKRLSLLYPRKYQLKQNNSTAQYHTTLRLQLKN